MISVEAAASVDDDLCAAVAASSPSSPRSSPPPSRAVLERIVADPATTLFVARGDGGIVGMLTLATFQIPTGVRAWIEDVVVDDAARGSGVAAALVQAALERVGRTRRPHGGPDLAARPRGGQPALRAAGLRGPPDQRVPQDARGRRLTAG